MTEGIRFRDCECPGTPHAEEGDRAFLRPHLDFTSGAIVNRVIIENFADTTRLSENLGPIYLERAFDRWNLWDEDGPIAFDNAVLMALPFEQAMALVEAADEAFSARVLDPFTKRIASLSPSGQTGANSSTSATRKSPRRSPARSARSSPNGTAASRP
jgi:hypothetical protein